MKKSVMFTMILFSLVCSSCSDIPIDEITGFDLFDEETTESAPFGKAEAESEAADEQITEYGSFGDINITVNGEYYDVKPLIINGTSYFPIRALGYALNCSVDWDSTTRAITLKSQSAPVDKYTQSADEISGTKKAIFDDNIVIYADGKTVAASVALVDNRSYVPVKRVAEAMGKRATWYADTNTVKIVNPDTADVEDNIRNYYVYNLPEIESEEDYLVGNWRYKDKLNPDYNPNYGIELYSHEYMISKNSDGTYKVIYKMESFYNEISQEGIYSIIQYTGTYDKETGMLNIKNVEVLENEGIHMSLNSLTYRYKLENEAFVYVDYIAPDDYKEAFVITSDLSADPNDPRIYERF